MQPVLVSLSCALMGLKSQTHFPCFQGAPLLFHLSLFSHPYSSCAHSLPTTCVPAAPGPPHGVSQTGEPLWRKGLKLPGTRDKHPLDIPAHPWDPSLAAQGGKKPGVKFTRTLDCYFRFIALSECVPLCVCVLHTLLQPAADVAHFLECVSLLAYQHPCWLFPRKCVLIEAISWRMCVVCVS